MHKYRYFLSATIAGEKMEREVTLEEFCAAERAAGFRPKLWSGDPAYMATPATGGFGSSTGISGRMEYVPNADMRGLSGKPRSSLSMDGLAGTVPPAPTFE